MLPKKSFNTSKNGTQVLAQGMVLTGMSVVGLGTMFLMGGAVIGNDVSAETTNTDVALNIDTTIAVATFVNGAAANSVSVNVTPSDSGTLAAAQYPVAVQVSTNNATGYTLTMSSSTSNTNMTHTNGTNNIPTLSSSTTWTAWGSDSNLNNRWGYTHNNNAATADASTGVIVAGTYLPVTPLATPNIIKVTSVPATDSSTNVTFATKIDTSQTSGTYSDTVTFSAIANFASGNATDKTIYDISTMQEMTGAICSATTTPLNTATTVTTSYSTNTSLIPQVTLRDTRDGHNYTVRKLADGKCWMTSDLRLPGGTTLTSADSNVTTSYTLPTTETSNDNGATLVNSSAFGDNNSVAYVYDNPNNENGYASSYYSFQAATAGTGSSVTTNRQNAPASVCPKGWKLPTGFLGDDHTYEQDSDFLNLMTTYGYERDTWYWNMTETGRQAFESAFAPLYAGSYYPGSFNGGGVYANYWASTVFDADDAYFAYFGTDGLAYSADYYGRYYGYQVRCIASS